MELSEFDSGSGEECIGSASRLGVEEVGDELPVISFNRWLGSFKSFWWEELRLLIH